MSDADWIKFLLGVIFTMLCSAGSFVLGARGKMSVTACAKCQDACKKEQAASKEQLTGLMDGIKAKQAELSSRQDELDDDINAKLDLLFSMLRAVIVHLPIDEKEKIKIINGKG